MSSGSLARWFTVGDTKIRVVRGVQGPGFKIANDTTNYRYVALLETDPRSLDLGTWVLTLESRSGKRYQIQSANTTKRPAELKFTLTRADPAAVVILEHKLAGKSVRIRVPHQ